MRKGKVQMQLPSWRPCSNQELDSQEIGNASIGKRRRSNELANSFSSTLPVVKFLSQSHPQGTGLYSEINRKKVARTESDPEGGESSVKELPNVQAISMTSNWSSSADRFIAQPVQTCFEGRSVVRSGNPFGYLDVKPEPYPHVGTSSRIQFEVGSSSMLREIERQSRTGLTGFVATVRQMNTPCILLTYLNTVRITGIPPCIYYLWRRRKTDQYRHVLLRKSPTCR